MQSAPKEFKEQADTFKLSMTLSGDQNELCITLLDFVDWVVYCKTYQASDVKGPEINNVMSLKTIYETIADSEVKEKGILRQYRFGDIVQVKGDPAFKIERGGKLSVFQVSRRGGVKECKLVLAKGRDMTEVEKQAETQNIEQSIMGEGIGQRVKKLEEENKQLKSELAQRKKQVDEIQRFLRPIREAQRIYPQPQQFVIREGLTFTNLSEKYSQYTYNQPLKPNESSKFKLKVIRLNEVMEIGIAAYFQKDKKKILSYFCSSTKMPENVQEGSGYKVGDIVEVQVDRVCNHIKYFVNDKLQVTQTNPMLADSSLVFKPLVTLFKQLDSVEWLMYQ